MPSQLVPAALSTVVTGIEKPEPELPISAALALNVLPATYKEPPFTRVTEETTPP